MNKTNKKTTVNSNKKELNLCNLKLSSASIVKMISAMKGSKFNKIKMSNCGLGDKAIKNIISAIVKNKIQVEILDFSKNKLTATGCKSLIKELVKQKMIKKVMLSGNKASKASIDVSKELKKIEKEKKLAKTKKKVVSKKTATKKTVAKKKTVTKKATAKKTAVKKSVAKKPTVKKTSAKKTVAKKPSVKKSATKKTNTVSKVKKVAKKAVKKTMKKSTTKKVAKTATKKVVAKKPSIKETLEKIRAKHMVNNSSNTSSNTIKPFGSSLF